MKNQSTLLAATLVLASSQTLDKQAETISPQISDRLDTARLKALTEQGSSPRSNWRLTQWLPAVGACASVLLVVMVLNIPDSGTLALPDNDQDLVLELVLTNPDMELMEEDLEFYLWMAEENS